MPNEGFYRCQLCHCNTEQVRIATAAQIAKVTNRTIYLWASQGRVHVNRINNEALLICKVSLDLAAKYVDKQVGTDSIDLRIKLVIKLAEQQYERDDPTLNKMAKHTGLSIWYLPRLFKKTTGISFGEYVRNLRLKKAEKLLQDPTLSIKEIAAAVGYKHVSDFDHHFKSRYGMRPGEYRRSQQI
jgi:transcriptional regulator GlxA family with amidase domain